MARKLALLSVYNKAGIVEFARQLLDLGFDLMASGGTAKTLADAGLPVTDVAELVGGKAILGHRVVTLSRELYAALLSTTAPEDVDELAELGIRRIDLVYVDMYPLREATADSNATAQAVIEKTDVGGPTMLHGGSKGQRIVVCDPEDRAAVLAWLRNGQPNEDDFIRRLMAKAEFTVASYIFDSAKFHSGGQYEGLLGTQVEMLRYGENPHQPFAALYQTDAEPDDHFPLGKFALVEGGRPSFINMTDLDRLVTTAVKLMAGLARNGKTSRIALAVKHGNVCGAGCHPNPEEALKSMIESDPTSLFGGCVLVNFPLEGRHAELLKTHRGNRVLDLVAAPSFNEDGKKTLARENDRCRMFKNRYLEYATDEHLFRGRSVRQVRGGFLVQDADQFVLTLQESWIDQLKMGQGDDLLLAWAIGSTATSNSIVIVKNGKLIGRGLAQPSRVLACKVALLHAEENGLKGELKGAVAYSDSFFPFTDGPEVLAEAGIGTIFATSGSVRDADVQKFCESKGIILLQLPDAEARGFFGH